MFKFNSNTIYNKIFKVSDMLKRIKADKDVKQDAKGILSLTLKNNLTPKTLNCAEDSKIKEIYIFEIDMAEQRVPELFIKKLDADIKIQTVFVVKHEDREICVTAYKDGLNKNKYFQTNWCEDKMYELPLSVNIPEAYKFILSKFFKYEPFEDENVEEYVKRYNLLLKLDFQINSTSIAIGKESQSRKKFEYNARLKEYKKQKEELLREKSNG